MGSRMDSYGTITIDAVNEKDWCDRRIWKFERDEIVQIKCNPRWAGRPDILAYEMYKRPDLWWVIMEVNDLIGIDELTSGLMIKIPGFTALMREVHKE